MTLIIFFPGQFELLFCVPDDQDPAITLVQRLQEKYPNVDTKLFIGKSHSVTACVVEKNTDTLASPNGSHIAPDLILWGKVLIFGRGMERKMGPIE